MKPLAWHEVVGVGADDVAVGLVPAGPLQGDLGVGRARPEVPCRDVPQRVAAQHGDRRVRPGGARQRREESGLVRLDFDKGAASD